MRIGKSSKQYRGLRHIAVVNPLTHKSAKILKNKWYHAKVLPMRFHLNVHTIGFCLQTQKLELHYMSSYY